MTPQEKQNSDLWTDFIKEDDPTYVQKSNATDGSEWTGKFDRRKTPRDEKPADNQTPD